MQLSDLLKLLLDMVVDQAKFSMEIITTPYGKLRLGDTPNSTIYRNLRALRKRRLIHAKKHGVKVLYFPTKIGIKTASKDKKINQRTDGLETIIIFDIPLTLSDKRLLLRRVLLKNNYRMIQRSVYASSYEISEKVLSFIINNHLERYVIFMKGKVIA